MTARFRLESVLRLRRTLRDECEARAADASTAALRADEVAAQRRAAVQRAPATGGDVGSFRAAATAAEQRAASSYAATAAADAARAAHRDRLDELVQASMAVTALERLEQRALDAAKAEEQRAEMREIDDLVTARFARARQAG